MSNVIDFPNTQPRLRTAEADDGLWTSHAERVRASLARLEVQVRGISEADRLAMTKNLGDLLEDRARDHGLKRPEALQQVWSRFDPNNELWPKRLRYVRFRDETKKGNELAASGKHFVTIAGSIGMTLPTRGVTTDRDLIEAYAKLMRGTTFDPDPMATARVDFDAARDLGELLEATVARIVKEVPGLPEYFRRIEMHGLTHPEGDEIPKHDPDARPMALYDYFDWLTDDFEAPTGSDVQWSLTASPKLLCEGFWFEDCSGVEAVLPRLALGRVTITTRIPCISEDEILGWAEAERNAAGKASATLPDDALIRQLRNIPDLLKVLSSSPDALPPAWTAPHAKTYEVQFMLVPSEHMGQPRIRAGLLVRMPWDDPLGWRRIYSDGELEIRVHHNDPSRRHVFRDPLRYPAPRLGSGFLLPPGRALDTLCLIPGEAADHVLGYRHTAPTYELADQTAVEAVTIEPNFNTPAGFTPQAATSLGGMMIRNLLYAKGKASLLHKLTADAQTRVERLEGHYQRWMRQYEAARQAFGALDSTDTTP